MIHRDVLFLVSRGALAIMWAYGLVRIWRFRHLPKANQVLAAALSMVLSNALLLLDAGPQDVLVFFNMMAQVVLVTAFAQVFKDFYQRKSLRATSMTTENITTLLGIGGASLFGAFSQYLWMH